MGLNGYFAWQQSSGPNVRFGSKADIAECETNVRFTPESGFVPNSGHCALLDATYSITTFADASRPGGTLIPIALAVDRLMASSNWVGCTTGMSAGFSPLRIRPV